jgi:YD repeat-containing protein
MIAIKVSIKAAWCLIFAVWMTSPQNAFAKGGYYWNLYCKESGRAGATNTCIPAIEGPWEYNGGSYGWQYHTKIYDTEGGVAADMAGYIDRKFSTCSPTVVYPPVKWTNTSENHVRISESSDMIMTVSRGTPRCESLTGGWQSTYEKTKRFYCPQGAQGPFKGDEGSRFCAIALHSCKKNAYTPNPISVNNGVKEFPRVYDDTVLTGFNLYRSYTSLPSYAGAGALNPSRTPGNTSLPQMRDNTTGWRLSYEATLSYYRNTADNRDVYTVDIPGTPPSVFVESSTGFAPHRSNSDSFQLVSNGDFIYRSGGGEYWVFDSARKLIATGNASGDKVIISGANPIIATNQFGRQLALHKDGNGVLSSIELPDGSELQYDFDSSLRLETVSIQKVQGTFPVSKYYYEDTRYPWAITGVANESGQRISVYEYDDKGRAFQSSNFSIPSVDKYTLSFSSGTQVIDPLGTARKYTFTPDGFSTVDILDPKMAPSAAITNDVKGRPFVEYDFNNNQACVFYEESTNKPRVRIEGMKKYAGCGGYDTVATLPVGARKISTEWHPDWNLPTRIAEPLRRRTYVYNGQPDPLNGNAIASCAPAAAAYPDGKPLAALCKLVLQDTTDATGASGFSAAVTGFAKVWTYAYNAQGQRISETQPAPGGTTTYSYYTDTTSTHSVGDLRSIVDATGKTTVFSSYTTDGRLLQKTDPAGLVTRYTYDARGRLLTQAVGDLVTTMAYSQLGLVSSVTSPNGHSITYTYDAAQRLTGWSDNRGNSGTYVLDGMGNRTAETIKGAGGDVAWQLSRSISAINRPGSETIGGSQSTAHTYDGNGDVTSDTNGLSQVTSYGYDRLRRVSQITSPLNASATLAYNQLDAVIQAKDFKGVTTNFTRDALGNPLLETTPDAGADHIQQFGAAGDHHRCAGPDHPYNL